MIVSSQTLFHMCSELQSLFVVTDLEKTWKPEDLQGSGEERFSLEHQVKSARCLLDKNNKHVLEPALAPDEGRKKSSVRSVTPQAWEHLLWSVQGFDDLTPYSEKESPVSALWGRQRFGLKNN